MSTFSSLVSTSSTEETTPPHWSASYSLLSTKSTARTVECRGTRICTSEFSVSTAPEFETPPLSLQTPPRATPLILPHFSLQFCTFGYDAIFRTDTFQHGEFDWLVSVTSRFIDLVWLDFLSYNFNGTGSSFHLQLNVLWLVKWGA